MSELRYLASGDTGLTVDFGNVIDVNTNRRVMALQDEIAKQHWNGIVETFPTFRSLFIQYNPGLITYQELCSRLASLSLPDVHDTQSKKHILEVPVCYGARFGADLHSGEKLTGLDMDEIIAIHSGRDYRIYMLGFLPGFPYLGGLDERIHMPRLENPRTKIPAGSVGIGGSQTGVYPIASPGGWRLIGATPLDLYDPHRTPPILYKSGDYIRFRPIGIDEYYDIRHQLMHGSYEYRFFDEEMTGKEDA